MKIVRPKILEQALPYIYLFGGLIGFVAATILTIEKNQLANDPTFQPSCNINPIINCGSVMKTLQAEVFGFPNSWFGIIGFALIVVAGILLLAGIKFSRWLWLALQAGTTFGLVFVAWLQYQSLYQIGTLCPYCMAVWAVMIPMFWYTTLFNFRQGHMRTPKFLKGIVDFCQRHHGNILIVWYLIILSLILNRFWYYWQTLVQ